MVKLAGTISHLGSRKVLVIGDLMLDTYTIGKARRISPEAPVAVVQVLREENRAGGAGNVILNLISLGSQVVAVGRIGNDPAGEMLSKALASENVDIRGIVVQNNISTPVKNRVIADNQQIVRVDYEQVIPIPEMLEQQVIEMLPSLLQGVDVVAISDYGKGFLSRTLLGALIEFARGKGIPIIADPKGNDFSKYSGSTIIKPNLSEVYAAAGASPDMDLEVIAQKVLHMVQAEVLMVTRSEAGISIYRRDGESQNFPVRVREVKDVTGAGDTVLATLSCAIASGLPLEQAVQLSNVAAGLAIERFGCARITLSDLARRLLESDVINKVFDDEHLFALKEALKGRKYSLLGLSTSEGMTTSAFASIRQLGRVENRDLLVYLLDSKPDPEFVSLLSSLHEVNFIIIQSENLCSLFEQIQPEEIYALVNKKLTKLESLSSMLELSIP